MNDYEKLATQTSESAVKEHRKRSFRQYMLDNWIAIAALVLSVISILLQVC